MIIGFASGARRLGNHFASPLALDLTDDAVTLFARDDSDTWIAIASVPTQAPDFLDRLADLRTEAKVRDETSGPITLWLPPEQVLVRDYKLATRGADARHEARAKLAAETPYTPSELMVAIGPQVEGQPTKVLCALCQTVLEAQDYAQKWGFTPGAVSTRVAADIFQGREPVFRAPEPAPLRLARRAAVVGLAACTAGAVLLGVYGVSQEIEPLIAPKPERTERGVLFAVMNPDDIRPNAPTGLVRPSGTRSLQSLAMQAAVSTTAAHHQGLTQEHSVPLRLAGAPVLPVPRTKPGLKVGGVSPLPARKRPNRLDPAAVLPPKRPVALVRDAVDAVREEGRTLATAPAPAVPKADPAPAAQEAKGGSLVATVLPDAEQLSPPPPVAPPAAPSQPSAETKAEPDADIATDAEEDLTPTALAPVELDTAPKPRPGENPAPAPSSTAERQVDTANSTATASLAAPVERPATDQAAPAAEEPKEAEQQLEDETPTKFAALTAPQPLVRPKSVERQPLLRQNSRTVARDNAPRSVRTAAAESGLHLGETNLIGVLQGANGRQALVRLRDGGYLKVSRGDVVDGWRVRSIGRETLRLSKSGQNRTLLLVSR